MTLFWAQIPDTRKRNIKQILRYEEVVLLVIMYSSPPSELQLYMPLLVDKNLEKKEKEEVAICSVCLPFSVH